MSRYLTEDEIEYILDFIKPNKSIPIKTALSIVKITKDKYISQLRKQKVYPQIIEELKKNIQKNHIESLIHPGESVGIIAAQSIGERQTQNSIGYEEDIIIKIYDKIEKIKVGKFIDEYMKKFGFIDIKTDSHVKKCKNIEILTITSDEKIEWKEISEISRHLPKGDLLKVTTQSGRSVICTFSHSLLKKEIKNVVPVLGSDLKLGDKIPVIKRSPVPQNSSKNINVCDFLCDNDYDKKKSNLETKPEKNKFIYLNSQRIPSIIEIDDLFTWFIAIFLTNGNFIDENCKEMYIKFKKEDVEDFEIRIHSLMSKYCILFDIKYESNLFLDWTFNNNKNVEYCFKTVIFNKFLLKLCYNGKNKQVPKFIFGASNHIIKKFIAIFFKMYDFSRIDNLGLLNDIQFLLTYYGIYSRIVKNILKIQCKYVTKFNKIFGIYIPDIILEDDFQLLEDEELNKIATEFFSICVKNDNIKIKDDIELDIFMKSYENKEKKDDNFHQNNNFKYLKQVQNSDVVWEKIVKMELIQESEYSHKYVYDFSVKDNETFALFSGIVVHNTLNTLYTG